MISADRSTPASPAGDANIARHLRAMAGAQPERAALKVPRGRLPNGDIDYLALSFRELDLEVARWSARLAAAGIGAGDRTLVMVRQGLPLIASVFAMFRVGAVPVVIDPGMGLKTFLSCVRRSQPRALVGIPLAQLISRLFRTPFRSVRARVTASSSLIARCAAHEVAEAHRTDLPRRADDLAAILFTSGSTGAPKGVCYEHGMFEAQVQMIRDAYQIEPGEIDLPMLPVFALFNPALGMTTVVPEINPSRPADVDPEKIIQAIQQERVTNSFGSPTLWRKIGEHCRSRNVTLPSLRRVLCAGAPVPASLWQSSRAFLPGGKLHSPYGATEALPVTTVSADEVDATSVRGACVGRPLPGADVRIIAVTDEPIRTWAEVRELPAGEVGEIIVRGANVSRRYDELPEPTAAAKIPVAAESQALDGAVWHRMGDCGYVDGEGRVWFCGRKAERVQTTAGTLHTEPCEQVFRRHPRVGRCALIGLGARPQQTPAVVVEARVRDSSEAREFARELRRLALEHSHTSAIQIFYFREKFPVDVRHNAKIHRLTLAKWALTAKGFTSDPKR